MCICSLYGVSTPPPALHRSWRNIAENGMGLRSFIALESDLTGKGGFGGVVQNRMYDLNALGMSGETCVFISFAHYLDGAIFLHA